MALSRSIDRLVQQFADSLVQALQRAPLADLVALQKPSPTHARAKAAPKVASKDASKAAVVVTRFAPAAALQATRGKSLGSKPRRKITRIARVPSSTLPLVDLSGQAAPEQALSATETSSAAPTPRVDAPEPPAAATATAMAAEASTTARQAGAEGQEPSPRASDPIVAKPPVVFTPKLGPNEQLLQTASGAFVIRRRKPQTQSEMVDVH